jgi:hypothetical protein
MNNATMRSAIAVAALLFAGLAPATGQSYHGITCDDVRGPLGCRARLLVQTPELVGRTAPPHRGKLSAIIADGVIPPWA